MKNFAHLSCCVPIEAAGPVIGAAMPIVRVLPHLIRAWSPEVAEPGLALPTVAAVAASAATMAATRNSFFIPSSSSLSLLRRSVGQLVFLKLARPGRPRGGRPP